MLGIAADLLHAALDVRIELLAVRRGPPPVKTASAVSAASCPPSSGRAGLHDQRPALDRAGDVERPAHGQIFSLVIEHVHFRRVEIKPRLDVAHEGVVGEGIPQARDHVIEFARPLVALGVLHMVVEPEIQRGVRIGGGDDIPARTPAARCGRARQNAGRRDRARRTSSSPLRSGRYVRWRRPAPTAA